MIDFEEEDRNDDAARKIQKLAHTYIAKCRLFKIVCANFVKKFDRVNEKFYYKNKSTGEISFEKPKSLRSGDLEDPRDFESPDGYDPFDDASLPTGYALVILNNEFPRSEGRIPTLPVTTNQEYDELNDLLSHDFICKIPEENTYFLKNASNGEVKDAFERIKHRCKKKNYFVLYFCTHVLTVVGGEEKNKSETSYFAMRDSVFTKPIEIAKSCLSLTDLVKMMKKLPCKRKSAIVNYCHTLSSENSFFAPVKLLYPPSDMLSRLADQAECAVLATCVQGMSMSENLKHGPHIFKSKAATEEDAAEEAAEAEKIAAAASEEEKEAKDISGPGNLENDAPVEDDDEDEEDDRDLDNEDFQTALGGGVNYHAHLNVTNKIVEAPKDSTQQLVERYLTYWGVPADPDILISPRPSRPLAKWRNDEETEFEYEIDMPTQESISDHFYSTVWWQSKRLLRPPVNFIKLKYREYLRRHLHAPLQSNISIPGERFSVFVDALTQGLRGGCHKPTKRQITIKALYDYVSAKVQEKLAKYRNDKISEINKNLDEARKIVEEREMKDAEEAKTEGKDDKLGKGKKDKKKKEEKEKEVALKIPGENEVEPEEAIDLNQMTAKANKDIASINTMFMSPILFLPKKNPKAAKFPICSRCGPPAAPERPFIVRTGISEIALEWYDQPFNGVPPFKYQVEVRSNTRVYNKWMKCPSPLDITRTTFIVRDLPSGVPCQFRVKSYNNGGWSKYSLYTPMVTPGDELTPLNTQGRWRRIIQGGPLATIDMLTSQPLDRNEHIIGLHKLVSFANIECGFTKGVIQLKAAHSAVHGLKIFPDDPEIAKPAFLLLGWCLKEGTPGFKRVKIYLRNEGVPSIAESFMDNEKFRLDTAILNNISWLRGNMPRKPQIGYIPDPPEYIYPAEEENVDEDDDEEMERLACLEDIRFAEDKKRNEEEERMFAERATKAKEEKNAKEKADEKARKKQERFLRERAAK